MIFSTVKKLIFVVLAALCAFPAAAADHLFVVGDATWGQWSLDRTSVMLRDGENPDIFRYTGYLLADKEFKFLTETSWDRTEYRSASADPYILGEGSLIVCNSNANDNKFKVRESANYDIVCNLAEMKISVTKAEFQSAPVYHNVLYLVGDATPGRWMLGEALPLAQSPSDPFIFSARVSLSPGKFKIATNCYGGYNEQKFYFRDPSDSSRVSEDSTDDRQWTIDSEGVYNVTVNLSDKSISIVALSDATALGPVKSWRTEGHTLFVEAEYGTLELTLFNDMVVKVFTRPAGMTEGERRSISVCASPVGTPDVSESDVAVTLSTPALRVDVAKVDGRISFRDPSGRLVLREKGGLDNSSRPRRATFEGMGDAAFYGGGYNGQRIDHDGSVLYMNNTQTGGWDATWSAPHNICIPFIVSASGYGLYFDDHYRHARISPSSSEGTKFSTESLNPVAYYFIGSADGGMASVLENYTFLTGRQELPPYWALGYLTSRYGYHSRQEAEEIVDGIKNAGLPLDGIVFDLYWQGERNNGMGNLDWYAPKFDDPAGMMSAFDARGVKTISITEPFFTSVSSNYETLRTLGYFADEDVAGMEWLGAPKTGLIDASNPDAMDWMWNFYKERTREGVAGWWLDLGEPERHDEDSRHAGGTVSQIHNEFGDLWTARVYRGFKEDFPDVRPFIMPRAGTSGMQRYSAFPWTGDIARSYKGLEAQVPALLSAGMSGVAYMGNDIGGFAASGTDTWLYLRWIQAATFSSVMRTHSTMSPEPHLDCYAEVFPAVKKYIGMHYSYLPYTYTLARENAIKGTPLARPVNFHDRQGLPASPADCKDEYLWGRDILVAPVLTVNTFRRDITFPQGSWVDLNDMSRVYAGGSTVAYDAPLETLPHFGRLGAFIPTFTQTSFSSTGEIDNSRITVTYLIDKDAELSRSELFDDDRKSTGTLESGEYLLTVFEGRNSSSGHDIRIENSGSYAGMPATRTYTFVIPSYPRPVAAVTTASGRSLAPCASMEAFDAAGADAFYLAPDMTLRIKASVDSDKNETLSISSTTSLSDGALAAPGIVFTHSKVTGRFDVALPAGASRALITVRDLRGAVLAEIPVAGDSATIAQYSFPALPAGMYLATLTAVAPDGSGISRTIKCMN